MKIIYVESIFKYIHHSIETSIILVTVMITIAVAVSQPPFVVCWYMRKEIIKPRKAERKKTK